ncbi:MAG: hypothetical protein WBM07_11470 [Chitinivibrionales bacterium]
MAKIQNFMFFADILSFTPMDSINGRKMGTIDDVFAVFDQTYPRISGLMLCVHGRQKIKIPWKNVQKIDENARRLMIDMSERPDEPNGHDLHKNETLLKKTFFDKQIVNMLGSKVVRVNDLHLLREDTNLWLVHIDVGIKGLLRRLGWLNFVSGIFDWLLSYDIKDKFISWKYAQAIPTPGIPSLPYLQIPSTKLSELHPADLAEILADLGNDERITFFRTLDNSTAARTLQEMPLNIQIQLVESINPKRIADIINEMQMDEVVDLLAKLSHGKVQELYSYLPAETVGEIKDLLKHSWHGAGSLMNTEFIAVHINFVAGEVLNKIQSEFSAAPIAARRAVGGGDDITVRAGTFRHGERLQDLAGLIGEADPHIDARPAARGEPQDVSGLPIQGPWQPPHRGDVLAPAPGPGTAELVAQDAGWPASPVGDRESTLCAGKFRPVGKLPFFGCVQAVQRLCNHSRRSGARRILPHGAVRSRNADHHSEECEQDARRNRFRVA